MILATGTEMIGGYVRRPSQQQRRGLEVRSEDFGKQQHQVSI